MEWVLAALYRLSSYFPLPNRKENPYVAYLLPDLRETFRRAVVHLDNPKLNELFPRSPDGCCDRLYETWSTLSLSGSASLVCDSHDVCVYPRAIAQGERCYNKMTKGDQEIVDNLVIVLRMLLPPQ